MGAPKTRRPKMNKVASTLVLALACSMLVPGCSKPTDQPPVTVEDKIAKNAKIIRMGSEAIVSVGLVAIPNPAEAELVAKEAARVLDENVIPLLEGDEQALVDGLRRVLSLSIFDDNPKLAKLKMILEMGLPMLNEYIPADLADNVTDKIPADAKAYLVAFFTGARSGIANYLADIAPVDTRVPRSVNLADLRKKLAQ